MTCSVKGCVHAAHARGWCATHYDRWRRNGDPGKVLAQSKIIRFTPAHWERWWSNRLASDPKTPALRAGIDQLRKSFAAWEEANDL